MKRCPFCGTECLDQDIFCCACGASLQNVPAQGNNPGSVRSGAGKKRTGIIVAVAAVILIAALCAAFILWRRADKKEDDSNNQLTTKIGEDNASDGTGTDKNKVARITPAEVEKLVPGSEDEEEPEDNTGETDKEQAVSSGSETGEDDSSGKDPASGEISGNNISMQTCQVVNCKESITLRSQPSITASEICQIPLGADVTFVGTAGNGFYQITYNGSTGYSLASFLNINPYDTSDPTYMQVVNCTESITLRKTPNTKAEEFCQIPLGAKVQYLNTAENNFYMVLYNGQIGYALASYLKLC